MSFHPSLTSCLLHHLELHRHGMDLPLRAVGLQAQQQQQQHACRDVRGLSDDRVELDRGREGEKDDEAGCSRSKKDGGGRCTKEKKRCLDNDMWTSGCIDRSPAKLNSYVPTGPGCEGKLA